MKNLFSKLPALTFTALLLTPLAELSAADLKLASFLGDHMVLQRDKPVKICGWADVGAAVRVTFAGQTRTAKADPDGGWIVRLKSMRANAEGRDLVVTCGTNRATLKEVLVGEVWLLGGQSNMEMPLWLRGDGMKCAEGTRLVLDTDHPWLRILRVPQNASRAPQQAFSARWHVSKSRDEAISDFSALGYYIGAPLPPRRRTSARLANLSSSLIRPRTATSRPRRLTQ